MAPRSPVRLDAGRALAAFGALLLFVSLFVNWYGSADGDEGISAWRTFELLDVVLASLALVTILAALEPMLGSRLPRIAPGIARATGPVALVLVVVSIVDTPPLLLYAPDSGLEAGIWLALAATLLMTVGALLSRVRVSFVLSSREPEERDPQPSGDRAEPASSADPAAETRVMGRRSEPPGL